MLFRRVASHCPVWIGREVGDVTVKQCLKASLSPAQAPQLTHCKTIHTSLWIITERLQHVPWTGLTAHHLPWKVSSRHCIIKHESTNDDLNLYNNCVCFFTRAKELKALFGSFLQKSEHSITAQCKKSDKERWGDPWCFSVLIYCHLVWDTRLNSAVMSSRLNLEEPLKWKESLDKLISSQSKFSDHRALHYCFQIFICTVSLNSPLLFRWAVPVQSIPCVWIQWGKHCFLLGMWGLQVLQSV